MVIQGLDLGASNEYFCKVEVTPVTDFVMIMTTVGKWQIRTRVTTNKL